MSYSVPDVVVIVAAQHRYIMWTECRRLAQVLWKRALGLFLSSSLGPRPPCFGSSVMHHRESKEYHYKMCARIFRVSQVAEFHLQCFSFSYSLLLS